MRLIERLFWFVILIVMLVGCVLPHPSFLSADGSDVLIATEINDVIMIEIASDANDATSERHDAIITDNVEQKDIVSEMIVDGADIVDATETEVVIIDVVDIMDIIDVPIDRIDIIDIAPDIQPDIQDVQPDIQDVQPDVPVTNPSLEVVCDTPAVNVQPLVTDGATPRQMLHCTLTAREANLYLHKSLYALQGPGFTSVVCQVGSASPFTAVPANSVAEVAPLVANLLMRDVPTSLTCSAVLSRANGGPCESGVIPTGASIRMSLEANYTGGTWSTFANRLNLDVQTSLVPGVGSQVYVTGTRQNGSPFQLRNGYPSITLASNTPTTYQNGVDQNLFCVDEAASPYGGHSANSTVFAIYGDINARGAMSLSAFKYFAGSTEVTPYYIDTYPPNGSSSFSLRQGSGMSIDPAANTEPTVIVVSFPTGSEQLFPANTTQRYCLKATVTITMPTMVRPIRIVMPGDTFTTGSIGGNPRAWTNGAYFDGSPIVAPYLVSHGTGVFNYGMGIASDNSSAGSCDFFAHNPPSDLTVTLLNP